MRLLSVESAVKLVNGGSSYGTIEIYHAGGWGTICDDGWNNNAATVICRMLGFR